MTIRRISRKIKEQNMLTGIRHTLPTDAFVCLMMVMLRSIKKRYGGFEHVSLTFRQWLDCLAPFGIDMDKAFIEDLLAGAIKICEIKGPNVLPMKLQLLMSKVVPKGYYFDPLVNQLVKITKENKDVAAEIKRDYLEYLSRCRTNEVGNP